MPIQVTIAEIQILQQDSILLHQFVKDQPGKNKEVENAAKRIDSFAGMLMGMGVTIQI